MKILFLLLPCAVSVPSAFPVPFPVPFHGLCAPASDFAMWLTFLLKRDSLSFCFNKTYQKHIFAGRATRKCKRHWKRHWKGTGKGLGTDTAHGNSKNSSWSRPASLENNTRMCVCRSPVAVHTQYRRWTKYSNPFNTWTPSTPKLNVRGLARMFPRMDETNQTLETQIQSSYVQHWPLGVRGWRQLLIHGFEYVVHLL